MADSSTELVTMLPVALMGPVMGDKVSGSHHIIQTMLNGAMSATPRLFIPIVDVRDVAAMHILAMTNPAAAGQRFLLSNGPALELKDLAATIRDHLGGDAAKVPTQVLPDDVVRAAAESNPQFRAMGPTSATPSRPRTRGRETSWAGRRAIRPRRSPPPRRSW